MGYNFLYRPQGFQETDPALCAENRLQYMAYRFYGSMVFRQINQEIRFHKDLMIHLLNMAVSMMADVTFLRDWWIS